MAVFPGFDRIRIINLPSRPDRRAEMMGELRRIGPGDDPRVQFVDGVLVEDGSPFRTPGEKGVFLAQLRILRDCAAAGESLLILEDDVDFTTAASGWGRAADCDFAYGGYLATDPANLATSDIIGAHCIGLSARAVKALVPFLEALLEEESPPPIDGAYVRFRRQHPEMRTDFADPVVAIQRPSRSDITPRRLVDRIPVLRETIQLGRRAKRSLQRGRWTFGLREAVVMSLVGIAIGGAVAFYQVAR